MGVRLNPTKTLSVAAAAFFLYFAPRPGFPAYRKKKERTGSRRPVLDQRLIRPANRSDIPHSAVTVTNITAA